MTPALQVRDLWFGYAAGRPVLRELDLTVNSGEVAMLMGSSGSGKTSLLKLIKGLIAPTRGSIKVLGQPVRYARRGGRLDSRVAYIPQQLGLVRTMSALENTLVGTLGRAATLPSLWQYFPRKDVDHAHDLLERLGIGGKAQSKVYALSGGERQRVAIARSLMQRPAVLLADEFVSQLDPVTSGEIMQIISDVAADEVAVVVTTHELDIVARYAGRVLVLRDGAIALDRVATSTAAEELAAAMRA